MIHRRKWISLTKEYEMYLEAFRISLFLSVNCENDSIGKDVFWCGIEFQSISPQWSWSDHNLNWFFDHLHIHTHMSRMFRLNTIIRMSKTDAEKGWHKNCSDYNCFLTIDRIYSSSLLLWWWRGWVCHIVNIPIKWIYQWRHHREEEEEKKTKKKSSMLVKSTSVSKMQRTIIKDKNSDHQWWETHLLTNSSMYWTWSTIDLLIYMIRFAFLLFFCFTICLLSRRDWILL